VRIYFYVDKSQKTIIKNLLNGAACQNCSEYKKCKPEVEKVCEYWKLLAADEVVLLAAEEMKNKIDEYIMKVVNESAWQDGVDNQQQRLLRELIEQRDWILKSMSAYNNE
jgi:hypothetical protein